MLKRVLTTGVVVVVFGVILISQLFAYAQPTTSAYALAPTQDPCRDPQGNEICPTFIAFDGRINSIDALATITAYCRANRSLEIWSVINSVGQQLTTATADQIIKGLQTAASTGRAQIIADVQGMQLIALSGSSLQIADNRTGSGYSYTFEPGRCGLPTFTGSVVAPTAKPGTKPTATPRPGQPTARPPATKVVIPAVSGSKTEAQARIDLNIRRAASTSSSRIGFIPRGATFTFVARSEKSTWIKVNYGSLTGWVVAFYTNIDVNVLRALPLEK